MNNYKTPALIIIDLKESDIVCASGNDTYLDYPTDVWDNGSTN